MTHFITLILVSLSMNALANDVLVAIIDSGVDVEHQEIVGNIWSNPNETIDNRDEDGNGFQDDIYGWNFAENNNLVIDRSYLGTFSDKPRRFFEIQQRSLLGLATPEEIAWVREQLQDDEVMAELAKFGNFVHGTHVAGIAVLGTQAQTISVKLIPTEIKPFAEEMASKISFYDEEEVIAEDFTIPTTEDGQPDFANMEDGLRRILLQQGLAQLAAQQMNLLEEIGVYVNGHGASIANGSFGTGFAQAQMIAGALFKIVFLRDAKPDELDEYARFFMAATLENGKRFVGAAPNTLFVFAAGNDGTDNDLYPTSPTNIDAHNVISVAATFRDVLMAPFSNFGIETVDIAAPGMVIDSIIPGDERLEVSGTSQAAPYVAKVATLIKQENIALQPVMVRDILMGTVDKKAFLVGKVKSEGLVNEARALRAAQLTHSMGVQQAIAQAKSEVADKNYGLKTLTLPPQETFILPLPSTIKL